MKKLLISFVLNHAVKLTTLCIAALISTNAYAESCSSKCTKAGYANSHVDGTAPFCSGDCYDGSGDDQVEPHWKNGTGYIYCAGSCSDGSSCWSGSKQCICWNKIDCASACSHSGGSNAECTVRTAVDLTNAPGASVKIIGACDWSGDQEGVQECYCFYGISSGGPVMTPIMQ
ncbi:MAG: hypothetical protein GY712_07490 [Oceanicoccus sp.]|uniref:hypothetical protein n=1 Tax=Oceanicoccus sp. TaxID=2691044 RepID=UPI0026297B92|nr:hypothetical protein [Oceanicoccus sp.]MCP3907845.1 hypothetical protein [Oceanicoccus sp.]